MAASTSALLLPFSLRVSPIHHPKLSHRSCNRSFGFGRNPTATVKAAMGWVEFPKLSPAGKKVMDTVANLMDQEIGEALRPSQTAEDVRSFKGPSGEGSVTIRAGQEGSKVMNGLCFELGLAFAT